ncbi:glycerophosphodiester phosphodiesterase [Microbacterium aoyamense]|uniref:Glycerophosphodiester phosphodiesterase n=1 Tax=Microbacterium aoyamense TaxID=344166 RepID=A0ABN2PSR1_9MICO|nr:glycerophosphodiester phosphodiesterase family protein [Microbacterium aoyamense]
MPEPRHPFFSTPPPRVLAHRGLVTAEDAAHGVAENSFAAVAAAHAAGATIVESDCHLTRDGVVVLFHDDDLSRVTGDPRKVADVTADELETVMAPYGGLITLEQALEAFPTVAFNLDAKAEAVSEPMGRVIGPHGARVLVSSFSDQRRRAALRSAAGHAKDGGRPATSAGTGTMVRLLVGVWLRLEPLVRSALQGIDALQIPERQAGIRVLSPRLITAAHRYGVEVHVWTINDPEDMRRLIEMGVDGIVTDHADLALKTLT